jgi:hypothetical protein
MAKQTINLKFGHLTKFTSKGAGASLTLSKGQFAVGALDALQSMAKQAPLAVKIKCGRAAAVLEAGAVTVGCTVTTQEAAGHPFITLGITSGFPEGVMDKLQTIQKRIVAEEAAEQDETTPIAVEVSRAQLTVDDA